MCTQLQNAETKRVARDSGSRRIVFSQNDDRMRVPLRTPNAQDVLSGRGGGINSHKGNKTFREWVNQRKEEYNLAQNKKEKIAVAMQVVHQVHQQSPVPGRFLQRDTTTSGQWWVEISEANALAKTTQALREGAPKIRQTLRTNNLESTSAKKRKRKAVINFPTFESGSSKFKYSKILLFYPLAPNSEVSENVVERFYYETNNNQPLDKYNKRLTIISMLIKYQNISNL